MMAKTRKELNQEYLEKPKPAGVFQVKNTANGKVLLGSSLNLNGALNGHNFTLKIGSHRNKALQQDWDQYGAENFVFEVLEVVQVREDPNFNLSDELTLLEMLWLEKLQPFGDKGYNLNENIRQA
jgi:group I intron endonuclease